jgi:hypothetical protein
MLFVLTAVEGKEERPVAVVDNEQTANNWVAEGKTHNWIPFELNDVGGLGTYTPFKPAPGSPAEAEAKKREQEHQQLQKTQELVGQLQEANKKLLKILRSKGVKIPGLTASQLLTPAHEWSI